MPSRLLVIGLGFYLAVTLGVPLMRGSASDGFAEHAGWLLGASAIFGIFARWGGYPMKKAFSLLPSRSRK